MARATRLKDDLDGQDLPSGTEPVRLSLGDTTYQLHLSEENHGKLLACPGALHREREGRGPRAADEQHADGHARRSRRADAEAPQGATPDVRGDRCLPLRRRVPPADRQGVPEPASRRGSRPTARQTSRVRTGTWRTPGLRLNETAEQSRGSSTSTSRSRSSASAKEPQLCGAPAHHEEPAGWERVPTSTSHGADSVITRHPRCDTSASISKRVVQPSGLSGEVIALGLVGGSAGRVGVQPGCEGSSPARSRRCASTAECLGTARSTCSRAASRPAPRPPHRLRRHGSAGPPGCR